MNKLIGVLGACAILVGSAGLALAADATGKIKTIDAKTMIFTLDNGATYHADKGVDLSKLKVGEKVLVTYAVKNGANDATAVRIQ